MNGEEMLQLYIFHPFCMELQGKGAESVSLILTVYIPSWYLDPFLSYVDCPIPAKQLDLSDLGKLVFYGLSGLSTFLQVSWSLLKCLASPPTLAKQQVPSDLSGQCTYLQGSWSHLTYLDSPHMYHISFCHQYKYHLYIEILQIYNLKMTKKYTAVVYYFLFYYSSEGHFINLKNHRNIRLKKHFGTYSSLIQNKKNYI